MEKLRGELWERRAVDGKLNSSLEWPYWVPEDQGTGVSV